MAETRLSSVARTAVESFPKSDIELSLSFCSNACPSFVRETNDRHVKVGRSIRNLIELYDETKTDILEQCLQLQVQECELIASGNLRVPTVLFGNTGIQMPIVTLGCMRFQQAWGPRIQNMNMVYSDCQDNLLAILRYALKLGMNHIETARGYGCSELQIGTALKQMILAGECKREDFIIQTKVPSSANPLEFKSALETSLRSLQIDYVDLFAFHGLNLDEQYEWIFGKTTIEGCPYDNCYQVIEEFKAAGKVRHIGFSTHGSTDLIVKAIETDKFEYVNIHYHYFGSYTATGCYNTINGRGNYNAIKLLNEKQMGVFIISPFDKGGRLYAPSNLLRSLTMPDVEPMSFASYWIWNHHKLSPDEPYSLHTYTVGAGRPSDLDQPAVAAYLQASQNANVVTKLMNAVQRLDEQQDKVFDKEWVNSWWKGVPKNDQCKTRVEHNQIIWMYNCIKAFGMLEFAQARYKSLESNYYGKWVETLPDDVNIKEKVGMGGWGYVPGLPLLPTKDYSADLQNVPLENRKRIVEAELFVYNWCRDRSQDAKKSKRKDNEHNDVEPLSKWPQYKTLLSDTESKQVEDLVALDDDKDPTSIPFEWRTAYKMTPWPDFPDSNRPALP
jgi:uncharacterized protein